MKKYPYLTNLFKSIAFYGIFILLIYLLDLSSPTNLCSSVLAIILILFTLPLSSIAFIVVDIIKLCKGKKEHLPSLIVHYFVLIAWLFVITHQYKIISQESFVVL